MTIQTPAGSIAAAISRHTAREPLTPRQADELIVELAADILSDTNDMLRFVSDIKQIAAAKDIDRRAAALLVRSAAGLAT